MSVSLRVALLLGILIYVLIILRYLKQGKISLRRSILWFALALVLSSAVTRQQDRIKALTQRLALLEDTLAEMRAGEMSSDHTRPDLKKESVSSPDNRIDEEAKP